MDFKNRFSFNTEFNYKTISLLLFLIILPNLLALINVGTVWGFKIHFFQIAIFIAAILFGPKAGLLSGFVGSLYPAMIMHNPYLIIGNAILGFFVGLFVRYGLNTIIAVLLAFLIQLPWLIVTDYFFVSLPMGFIISLVIALAISNIIWATLAHYIAQPLKATLKC